MDTPLIVIGFISVILALLTSLDVSPIGYMIGLIIGKGIVYTAILWVIYQGIGLFFKKR